MKKNKSGRIFQVEVFRYSDNDFDDGRKINTIRMEFENPVSSALVEDSISNMYSTGYIGYQVKVVK
jgi:hypothetical protein